MKIKVSNNRDGLDQIRRSITVSADLAKFDQFIAKYPIIDLSESDQQTDMASCGENTSCTRTTYSVTIELL